MFCVRLQSVCNNVSCFVSDYQVYVRITVSCFVSDYSLHVIMCHVCVGLGGSCSNISCVCVGLRGSCDNMSCVCVLD